METLERMKEKGYIRYYGLSNIHSDDLAELCRYEGKFVSFQDEYSLACRKNEADIFELREKLKATPMTWGSLGQGILTGKYSKDASFGSDDRRSRDVYVNFHGDKLMKNLRIVDEMRPIAEKYGQTCASVAIRFILDYIPALLYCAAQKARSRSPATHRRPAGNLKKRIWKNWRQCRDEDKRRCEQQEGWQEHEK